MKRENLSKAIKLDDELSNLEDKVNNINENIENASIKTSKDYYEKFIKGLNP